MKVHSSKLNLNTQKQFEILDITAKVAEVVSHSGATNGVVTVFVPHSTASIKINHNEPLLLQDLMQAIYRLVPSDITYAHDAYEFKSESDIAARSNGSGHVKAFLLGASESIPFQSGKMLLGPRQSIFLVELDGGRKRNVVVTVTGE